MSFLPNIKKVNLLEGLHVGVVVSNEDPLGLGRIKCKILGLLEDSDVNSLPWCYRLSSTSLGDKEGEVIWGAPSIGSQVCISFPDGSIYTPIYSGGFQGEKAGSGYPDSVGMLLGSTLAQYNKSLGTLRLIHSSGTVITLSSDGSVLLSSNSGVTFDVPYLELSGDLKTKNGVSGIAIDKSGRVMQFSNGILVSLG